MKKFLLIAGLLLMVNGCTNGSEPITQAERDAAWQAGVQTKEWVEATKYFPNKSNTSVDEMFEKIIRGKTSPNQNKALFNAVGYNQLNSSGDNFFIYATKDLNHYISDTIEYKSGAFIKIKTVGGYGLSDLSDFLEKAVISGKLEINYKNKSGDTLLSNLKRIHSQLISQDEDKGSIEKTQKFIDFLEEHGGK